MSVDGITLHLTAKEIENKALFSRIDKIHQPSPDEIILQMRGKAQNLKLIISTNASAPRIHFTSQKTENPKTPPMFCQLLRKNLANAKLKSVRQHGCDRILFLDFDAVNGLLEPITLTLIAEIMGRQSNLILRNSDGIILDSIKRVTPEISSVRTILPGCEYNLPPLQNKLSLLENTAEQIIEKISDTQNNEQLHKLLLGSIEGVSPLFCRESAHFATGHTDIRINSMTTQAFDKLKFFLNAVISAISSRNTFGYIISDEHQNPLDFSFIDIKQYGTLTSSKKYNDFSQMLDDFYAEKSEKERMKQRSASLNRQLSSIYERITRKIILQKEELATYQNRGQLRLKADVLGANIHLLKKGETEAILDNFYSNPPSKIAIQLCPHLTPTQNLQKYYSDYKKASFGEKKLTELIESSENELGYIDNVLDLLARAKTNDDVLHIRTELAATGYIKSKPKKSGHNKNPQKLEPYLYTSPDGFKILVGRNNIQNDYLTFKIAGGNDIWFHVKNQPGSHTILLTENNTRIPPATMEFAAYLAAKNSKSCNSPSAMVDYTFVKFVKKMPESKPGMVTYHNFKTIFIKMQEYL